MSPTAKELIQKDRTPDNTGFVLSEEGARRINEHVGDEAVRQGDTLTYSMSKQEKLGGTPLFSLPEGGCVAVPHDTDFSKVNG